MAWFSRKDRSSGAQDPEPDAPDEGPSEPVLRPVIERLGVEEQQRVAAGRSALERAGIDVDDLAALGAAYDAALAAWQNARRGEREDERELVERFAIGIGDHLHRHTDLSWSRVTDAFGTDLAVAGGKDEFVVVPGNLVAARWMNAEAGWVPGVVGHLVRVRAER